MLFFSLTLAQGVTRGLFCYFFHYLFLKEVFYCVNYAMQSICEGDR